MKEKILELLKKQYSNLGLSKEVLNSYAEHLSVGLEEGVTDEELENKVKSVDGILKATQVFGDKRENDGKKVAQTQNKSEEEPKDNVPEEAPSWFKEYLDSEKQKRAELEGKLAELQAANSRVDFDTKVGKIAKELNLSGDLLDLAKAKLSSDMDETAIRNSLGETKQIFIKSGAIREDGGGITLSTDQAAQQEAKDWLDEKLKETK